MSPRNKENGQFRQNNNNVSENRYQPRRSSSFGSADNNAHIDKLNDDVSRVASGATGVLLQNGTKKLTALWDAGNRQATNLGSVMVQGTAPTDPAEGQVWLDTSSTSGTTITPDVMVVTEISTDTTLTTANEFIAVDTDAGDVTITLFGITSNTGRVIYIKNVGSNSVIIDADGSETIDGNTTATISIKYDSVDLIARASEWSIF